MQNTTILRSAIPKLKKKKKINMLLQKHSFSMDSPVNTQVPSLFASKGIHRMVALVKSFIFSSVAAVPSQ
jgi:predicted nucleotide-binding protein (sugar kinase/HSP70/actin superfamily)